MAQRRTTENLDPVYFGELFDRAIKAIRVKVEYEKSRYNPKKRVSYANIARICGTNYRTLQRKLCSGESKLTIAEIDTYLFAAKLSILDLLQPHEFLSYLKSMGNEDRHKFGIGLNKYLDRYEKAVHTHTAIEEARST